MSQTHKDKIVVIGAGNVGEAIAYTLMVRVQAVSYTHLARIILEKQNRGACEHRLRLIPDSYLTL